MSELLSHLINGIINNKLSPEALKITLVKSIYKKGENEMNEKLPVSYKPISVITIIFKIFEKVINFFSENYKVRSNNQYGFQKSLSTSNVI